MVFYFWWELEKYLFPHMLADVYKKEEKGKNSKKKK